MLGKLKVLIVLLCFAAISDTQQIQFSGGVSLQGNATTNSTVATQIAVLALPATTFPSTQQGVTSSGIAISLSNVGTALANISAIAIGGTNASDFAITTQTCGTLPAVLGPGTNCSITVTFTPSSTGGRSATLTVTSDAQNNPVSASLSGTGISPAQSDSTLTPSTLTFPDTVTGVTSSALVATLKSTGTATLNISSITLSGTNSANYAISANTCGGTLTVGNTCTVSITFTPSATGARVAQLNVASDGLSTPNVTSLTGNGINPPLTINTGSLPNATQNSAYSQTLSGSGGTPPYTWSITLGSLTPCNLSLNGGTGAITGTPLSVTTCNFTVKLADTVCVGAGCPTKALSITVTAQQSGQDDSRYCLSNETTSYPGGVTQDNGMDLPQVCVYTPLSATPSLGTTITVAAGDATGFQNALNTVACGQTITLAAGSTYTGSFTFPAHSCDSAHWITVRTSDLTDLPAEGVRALPCQANVQLPFRPAFPGPGGCSTLVAAMAKLKGSGSLDETIRFNPNADHYRLIGLEVEMKDVARNAQCQNAINMQPGTGNHLILDRMWIHGIADRSLVRGVLMGDGVSYVALINSSVTDVHCLSGVCADSQVMQGGFGSATKAGFKGVNNYTESAGTNSMGFGGGGASVMPTDAEWRRNYQYKPMIWNNACTGSPVPAACRLPDNTSVTYDGLGPYSVKNMLEAKNMIRFLIEGNTMENNWMHADQNATAILATPKNQSGNQCPLCVNKNWVIRYNHIISSGGALQFANAGADDGGLATEGSHYAVHDNLFEDLNYQGVANSGFNFNTYGYQINTITSIACNSSFVQHDIVIIHNTLVVPPSRNQNAMFLMDGPTTNFGNPSGACMTNMTMRDNIAFYGSFGINQTSNTACAGPLSTQFATKIANCWVSPFTMTKNVIVGGTGTWPAGNLLPANAAAVGWANYNNGLAGDYRLCTGVGTPSANCTGASAFHNQSTDGVDIGADVTTLNTYTTGVSPWN